MGIKAACIMMQKDESVLLRAWIDYHSYLFGSENLYIVDNGSTHGLVTNVLTDAEHRGVHVYRQFNQNSDYKEKGTIVAELIRELDARNLYDFNFPLDCDEFIAVEDSEGRSCERNRILQELERFREVKNVLATSAKYYHTPFQHNLYAKLAHPSTAKCFFARSACVALDHGNHLGESILGNKQVKTRIIYYEFHRKPFLEFRRSSLQKLSGRVSDFSRATLRSYYHSKKSGFHCAGELLHSKYEYYMLCQNQARIADTALLAHLDTLAINYSGLFEGATHIPVPLRILALRLRHTGLQLSILSETIGNKLSREVSKPLRIVKRLSKMKKFR